MAPRSALRGCAAALCSVMAVTAVAGCGTPADTPAAATPAAPTPVATVAATTLAAATAPVTGEANDAASAAVLDLMAEEALVNAEERLQALDLRLANLPGRTGPARVTELDAAAADLRHVQDQLDLVADRLEQGEPEARADRLVRLLTAAAGMTALVDRLADLPDGADMASPLRMRARALTERVNAATTAAPPAPASPAP